MQAKQVLIARILCLLLTIAFAETALSQDVQLSAITDDGLPVIHADNVKPTAFPSGGIPLRLTTSTKVDVSTWQYRTGIPLAVGMLKEGEEVRLLRDGKEIPVQTESLATWGPTSSRVGDHVRWLGLDFVDSLAAGEQPEYRLVKAKPQTKGRLKLLETPNKITIDTGRLELVINCHANFNLFDSVKLDGRTVIGKGAAEGAFIVDGEGNRYLAKHDPSPMVTVEMRGDVAAVVRAEGWFVNPNVTTTPAPGEPHLRPKGGFCRFVTRLYVAADQPDVRVQHTFILTEDSDVTTYRDIGISLPIEDDAAAAFGDIAVAKGEHAYLLQHAHDQFSVNQITQSETSQLHQGQRAKGWVATGKVAVGLRDFWQNFPKELEVDPQAGKLLVHLWPHHGKPRRDTTELLTDENAWRLPFVHSGEALDFRPPAILKDEKQFPELHAGGYVDNMFKANAIGISRTHDILVSFAPQQMDARMQVFNSDPHVMADSQFIASTGVFGPIPAVDKEERPLLEHRYNSTCHFIDRASDESQSFGIFNYRDLHTYLRIEDGIVMPNYRRLWAATHYNYPRAFWWQYWRSGDHAIGLLARRNSQHIMDVDICHWTNELFESREHQPAYYRRKAVGGLCDYKGVVHWHSGDRNAYNACVDFMLYDYYLRGNRRAWDVANIHAMHIVNTGTQNIGRGAAGQADTLVEFYKATWNPEVGRALVSKINSIIRTPADSHDQKLDWTPWITRYWDLTQDPQIKAYLLDWLNNYGHARMNLWAYGYYITGNEKYAKHVATELFEQQATTIQRNDKYDGLIGRSMKPWADEMTASLLSLKAGEAGKLNLIDFQPKDQWPYFTNWGIQIPYTLHRGNVYSYFNNQFPWPEDGAHRLTSYVYHDGKKKTLWLGVQNTAAQPGADVRLFNPKGKQIKHVNLQHFSRVISGSTREGPIAKKIVWPRGEYPVEDGKVIIDGKAYKNEVTIILQQRPMESFEDLYALCSEQVVLDEEDPKGFYKVVHEGVFYTPVPILPPDGKVWLKVGAESTIEINSTQYFFVPEDCEQFQLSFLPTYEKRRFYSKLRLAAGAIVNPDSKAVAAISCGLETDPQVVTMKVPPAHRGKAWAVTGSLFSIVGMKNLPPYISPSMQAMTSPPHVPTEQ